MTNVEAKPRRAAITGDRVIDRIRRAAKERKVSLFELAQWTGLTPSRFSKWSVGQGEPSLRQAARIAHELDVPLDSLVGTDPPRVR